MKQEMSILRSEVLRWNRSISLVSRKAPERIVDELIDECVASGKIMKGVLADLSFRYIDLGTGGGFPGLVWAYLFGGSGCSATHLVEPRGKRAWFLQQTAAAMGLGGVDVREEAWGTEMAALGDVGEPAPTIISVKALDLGDDQVLEGWRAFAPDAPRGNLVIVRFVSSAGEVVDRNGAVALDADAPLGLHSGHFVLPYPSQRPDSALHLSIHSNI